MYYFILYASHKNICKIFDKNYDCINFLSSEIMFDFN